LPIVPPRPVHQQGDPEQHRALAELDKEENESCQLPEIKAGNKTEMMALSNDQEQRSSPDRSH
jgi:hypothetical protein